MAGSNVSPIARKVIGAGEFRELMAGMIKTFVILDYTIVAMLIERSAAAVHWRAKIRSSVTDQTVETDFFDLIHIENGQIVSFIEFCDTALAARMMQGRSGRALRETNMLAGTDALGLAARPSLAATARRAGQGYQSHARSRLLGLVKNSTQPMSARARRRSGCGLARRCHRGVPARRWRRLSGGRARLARVADGEFVTIVGPTGCGKSTLLNIAAGLIAPTSGRADIFGKRLRGSIGRPATCFRPRRCSPGRPRSRTLRSGWRRPGPTQAEARERAQAWLTRVGLSDFGARYPHMLSGGQRKRVGLVQVLIRDPKILLMDEPFGPLDAQTRQIMGNLLLDLWNADRKAVLFVTHDLEEAIALSDRVVIMSAGPAARVIGDWKVALPRPRDMAEVKLERAFHDLHREIWATLKAEVLKGYAQTGGG